jgi:hypothetical protein
VKAFSSVKAFVCVSLRHCVTVFGILVWLHPPV